MREFLAVSTHIYVTFLYYYISHLLEKFMPFYIISAYDFYLAKWYLLLLESLLVLPKQKKEFVTESAHNYAVI